MTPTQRERLNAAHDRLAELTESVDSDDFESLRREAAEMCVLLMELELVTMTGEPAP